MSEFRDEVVQEMTHLIFVLKEGLEIKNRELEAIYTVLGFPEDHRDVKQACERIRQLRGLGPGVN